MEDSLTTRKHLVEVLDADPELQVAGEAEDGKRAIELCRTLRPDVVTLDIMLPVMSGVAVTEYVMAYCPTPNTHCFCVHESRRTLQDLRGIIRRRC